MSKASLWERHPYGIGPVDATQRVIYILHLSLLRKVIDSADLFQVERMSKMLFRTIDPSLIQEGGEGAGLISAKYFICI
jgi:hypothetical protein